MRVLQISVEEAGNQILRTQRQLHEVQEDMSHLKKAVVACQEATDVKVDAVFKELVELKSLVAESVKKTGTTPTQLVQPAPEPSLPQDVPVHPVSGQVPAQEPSGGSPHSLDSYVPCSLSEEPDPGGPSRKIPIEEESGSESEDGTECPGPGG
eukprot:jgi/Mesvir1/26119/Mv06836-RA.1